MPKISLGHGFIIGISKIAYPDQSIRINGDNFFFYKGSSVSFSHYILRIGSSFISNFPLLVAIENIAIFGPGRFGEIDPIITVKELSGINFLTTKEAFFFGQVHLIERIGLSLFEAFPFPVDLLFPINFVIGLSGTILNGLSLFVGNKVFAIIRTGIP